jgi:hypothetical protein
MPTMTCELEFDIDEDAAEKDPPKKNNKKAKDAQK